MDILAGTAATLLFDLQGPAGTLLPDDGSVKYWVYGQTGTTLSGPTAVTTSSEQSSVPVVIAEGVNTIDVARRFEKRSVHLVWTSGGRGYSARQTYRILPFLNITAQPEDVRGLLGLSDDELADHEIDLFEAYIAIEDELTKTVLDAALSSGTSKEVHANLLIAVDCALRILPSMQTRTLMAQTEGDLKAERFRNPPDYGALEVGLRAKRADAIATITDTPQGVPVLLTFALPTDVITGL